MTREKRNERYGFGRSKRHMKRDDGDVGDMSSFDRRGRRGGFRGRGRGGAKRGGTSKTGKTAENAAEMRRRDTLCSIQIPKPLAPRADSSVHPLDVIQGSDIVLIDEYSSSTKLHAEI
jgi:hypothetical protein